MLFRVLMLLSLYAASAHGQDFICGYDPTRDGATGQSSHQHNPFFQTATQTAPIDILVLFGQFTDDRRPQNLGTFRFVDRTHTPNHRTTQLIDPSG